MALHIKGDLYSSKNLMKRFDSKYYLLQDEIEEARKNPDFDVCPLGSLVLKVTDGEHAGQKFVDNGVLFLKNSSIKDFDISLSDGFYITKEKHEKLKRSALVEEDVLFTTIGHLGSASIVPINFCEANMNQNFVKMTIDKTKINPYYLTTFLNSKFARKQVNSLLTGNIQSLLTYPKIKNIQIVIPKDSSIQLDIDKKLKEAFKLSSEANKLIKKAIDILDNNLELNEIEKSKFFSINSLELQDTKIWLPCCFSPRAISIENQVRKKFKCVDLNVVTNKKPGDEPGSDVYISYLEKVDNDIPFVRTSDLYNYQIDLFPDNYIDEKSFNDCDQQLKNGDILFSKDGKIGEIAIYTSSDKALVQSGVEIVRINDYGIKLGLTQEYLFACMASKFIGKNTAERYTVTASTIPHLKEERLGKMPIPLLNNNVINEISTLIKQASKKISHKKKLILECQDMVNKAIPF